MMVALVIVLPDRPPVPRPTAPPVARWEWLAFFEAYFSNFIEGTEFGVTRLAYRRGRRRP
jgi:hypothetical protein